MRGKASGVLNIHRGSLNEMTFATLFVAVSVWRYAMDESFYSGAEIFNTA